MFLHSNLLRKEESYRAITFSHQSESTEKTLIVTLMLLFRKKVASRIIFYGNMETDRISEIRKK